MRITREVLHDVYFEDHRAAVMAGTDVLVLSELASTILASTPEGRGLTLEELTQKVVDFHGEPEGLEDARELVLDNVHDLARHRILAISDSH